MKKALISGITGQDGAYLAKLLLEKGYSVAGAYRRTSTQNFWRLEELGMLAHPNFELVEHDLTDLASSIRLVQEQRPDELYNLAAQSFVETSFKQPSTTAKITGLGPLNFLEAIQLVKPDTKFYQASTSEMFGKVQQIPQTEETDFYPRSPYGAAKLYAHWMTINYRESYNLFAASGILFNHESPLRGSEFVTRKISQAVASIASGSEMPIQLGNLDSLRDWGYAPEYVEGMWRMLQVDKPETYVLATNSMTSVRDFVKMAFNAAGISIRFEGVGVEEVGLDEQSGKTLVVVNPKFFRPAEVDLLIGDPAKAKLELGWEPQTSVETLCELMVKSDLDRVRKHIAHSF